MESEISRTFEIDQEENKTPILIMTVDIGDSYKDNIIVYHDSCLESVIQEFSIKHTLTQDQEKILLKQLKENLHEDNNQRVELSKNEYFQQWNQHIDKHLAKDLLHHPKINKKSIEIMQQRQVLPVYERLYSLSAKNQSQPCEPKLKPTGIQCGSRLYNNWIIKKKERERLRLKNNEIKEQEVTKDLTFKPQINQNLSVPSVLKQDPVFLQKSRQESLERKRYEQLAKEQENCPFTPQINPISDLLLQNRYKAKPKSKFIELYEEATTRKEKNEELIEQYYESQYNFKPDTCSIVSLDIEDHVERLYTSRKETEEYLQNRRKELNQLIDPVTGQEFFKPKIGRPPKSQRNQAHVDYLYSFREKKSNSEHKISKLDLVSKNKSEEILNKRKRARYHEIFDLLNPHNCEKIYTEVISTQLLHIDIIKILMPLLQELQESQEKLDFDEFFDSMENLCKVLTPEERNVILKDSLIAQPRPEEIKRGSASVGKMYSRNLKYKEEVEAKLLAERIKKNNEELKECTFHPKIKVYHRDKQNRNYGWIDINF